MLYQYHNSFRSPCFRLSVCVCVKHRAAVDKLKFETTRANFSSLSNSLSLKMASASSMPRQELTSLLECSVCLETFDNPRTLHCLHSFCKKCLENFVKGKSKDQLNCPVCRCKFTLDKEGKRNLRTFLHAQNHRIFFH